MSDAAPPDHELDEFSEIREIKANYDNPTLGNCTKVVRIFVIRAGQTWKDFVKRSPTRSDVFVDVSAGYGQVLEPMTFMGKGLIEHHKAHHMHPGTIPVLKGKYRDQLEWQCDVPFEVSKIEKVNDDEDMHGFYNYKGQEYPFIKPLAELKDGGPDRPIRSGPTVVVKGRFFRVPWKQLYKAHFKLQLENGGRWVDLDPDFFCDSH